jgi:hypothetical protein
LVLIKIRPTFGIKKAESIILKKLSVGRQRAQDCVHDVVCLTPKGTRPIVCVHEVVCWTPTCTRLCS